MTATLEPTAAPEATETFDSLDPATGDVVGTHPVMGADEVDAAVARAREAVDWWGNLSFDERADFLLTWRSVLTRRIAQLADLSHRETGKPHGDAQLEIVLAIDHIAWAAKNAKKVLGPRKVSSGLLMANQAATVAYHPLGVVGVIGPWNYPVFTPMGSIAYALAAGNAVVFKPSEYTPGVGQWLADSFREVVHGRDVLQVVTGLGETGNALCKARIDKLAFTGSGRTGKKVMAACAENLTPVVIEAGGKDSLIVDEDADLSKAAEAALWGGMSNAGQTCIGTERVYVHQNVFDAFMTEILDQAKGLRAGADSGAKIGPITMPSQLGVIKSHIDDAIARGAKVALGGSDAVGERFVQPTILTHVPEDSTEITEETFGPTLAINPVAEHGRGRTPHQRHRVRPRRCGVLQGQRCLDRPPDPLRDDLGQQRDRLRRRPRPALRRRRAVRLRPDPRPRRPARVHLRQGHHAPEVRAGDEPDVVRPRLRHRRQGRPAHHPPARGQADPAVS